MNLEWHGPLATWTFKGNLRISLSDQNEIVCKVVGKIKRKEKELGEFKATVNLVTKKVTFHLEGKYDFVERDVTFDLPG